MLLEESDLFDRAGTALLELAACGSPQRKPFRTQRRSKKRQYATNKTGGSAARMNPTHARTIFVNLLLLVGTAGKEFRLLALVAFALRLNAGI